MSRSKTKTDIQVFASSDGAEIFQVPLEAFPGFWVYAYIVLAGDYRILIDTGSGLGSSYDHLLAGFEQVSARKGSRFQPESLTHILITHGHIDHFGGLVQLAPTTQARIGIHGLDRRTLVHFEERLMVTARRLRRFFIESGVEPSQAEDLMEMYLLPKSVVHSVRVDFTYEQVGMQVGPMQILHTPGHCAGQVCIRLNDVLFSGDHILSQITPHQAPEQLTLNTGLRHYLQSLEAVGAWADGVALILAGHQEPFFDLHGRLNAIRESHRDRLIKVLDILQTPSSTATVSQRLFGETSGYNTLLALEETGAHIEYLYSHGLLALHNLQEIDRRTDPVPVIYRTGDMIRAKNLVEHLLGPGAELGKGTVDPVER